jgi:alkanesulfonate monooxygenase SsuD/methylene tetrahydromethanopterin reductase-like flavin-dependent oxidoreductase (luciferase family)
MTTALGVNRDYGRPLEFGLSVVPNAADLDTIRELAAAADAAGIELLGIQDHPYQWRFFETWALIADLLARTERLRIFPDVANLPLRLPAMIAKQAASLDLLSGGRFELGIGAGAFWEAIAAMGGPVRGGRESVEALEEAIEVIRAFWSGERTITFSGSHYSVAGLHPGPRPAHEIEIWVGAYKPRMLDLVGRRADGWVPSFSYAPPAAIPEMQRRIDAGAAEAGREAASIRRAYNLMGEITAGASGEPLHGPVSHWVETLTGFALDLGLDTFVFGPDADPVDQLGRFAEDVVPAVREGVAKARGAGPLTGADRR